MSEPMCLRVPVCACVCTRVYKGALLSWERTHLSTEKHVEHLLSTERYSRQEVDGPGPRPGGALPSVTDTPAGAHAEALPGTRTVLRAQERTLCPAAGQLWQLSLH